MSRCHGVTGGGGEKAAGCSQCGLSVLSSAAAGLCAPDLGQREAVRHVLALEERLFGSCRCPFSESSRPGGPGSEVEGTLLPVSTRGRSLGSGPGGTHGRPTVGPQAPPAIQGGCRAQTSARPSIRDPGPPVWAGPSSEQ